MTTSYPVRRTTIVVSDIEKSLFLYKDLLRMEVFYDQVIEAEATGKLLGVPDAKVRIVSLQGDKETVGMVGLLSFLSPSLKPRQEVRKVIYQPDLFLLMMAEDIDIEGTFYQLRDAGIEILCPPLEYKVPQRGLISGFTCIDPDGIALAIMQFGPLKKGVGTIKGGAIRRTSIIINDLNESFHFYRDILGLTIFYDQEISSEEEGRMLGVPGARVRIISLQGGDCSKGMVGLLSFIDPPSQPRKKVRELINIPDVALIFNTNQIEMIFKKLQGERWEIQSGPIEYEIPGRGLCTGLSCYDPNGILIEFTQFGPLR